MEIYKTTMYITFYMNFTGMVVLIAFQKFHFYEKFVDYLCSGLGYAFFLFNENSNFKNQLLNSKKSECVLILSFLNITFLQKYNINLK